MTTNELRQKYLDFFKDKGHAILPSASLLPENDPTTLFTGSGMQSMIPYLLGEKHPQGKRLADSQKCFRAQDMEAVGDNRHTTFFEMLGNWSLGDYFKPEQIAWLFEFLTVTLGLDANRLYVTCFRGNERLNLPKDEESVQLWAEEFKKVGIDARVVENAEQIGMQTGRIFYYDETKNWWSRSGLPQDMPVGEPGGPDSEVFWDFGENLEWHERSEWKDKPCHVNCDCGRFLEIGNSVFMEYKKVGDGFESLPQKNVDFGGGLERMMAAVNDNPDVFTIDIFAPLRTTLEQVSGKKYGTSPGVDKAFRVMMDHLRAAAFLIADGTQPANKDQGYFTRRLMRRAIRYAYQLDITDNFCAAVGSSVTRAYADVYPYLSEYEKLIATEMNKEEEKFRRTLKHGLKRFEEVIKKDLERETAISGKDGFDLYQSFGFPLEMTMELAKEKGVGVDLEAFQKEAAAHQAVSRQGADRKFAGGLADHSENTVRGHTATHLLHAALRQVLGKHIQQKGSNITPERIRFDFSHPARLSAAELRQVEDLVNAAVARNYPVSWQELKVAEAYKKNVIGFFPERYDEVVKVYTVGDPQQPMTANPTQPTFSQEICGGPHVERTAQVGRVKIVKEEALGAGVRRIKAVLD